MGALSSGLLGSLLGVAGGAFVRVVEGEKSVGGGGDVRFAPRTAEGPGGWWVDPVSPWTSLRRRGLAGGREGCRAG